jgi:hypothetical protein
MNFCPAIPSSDLISHNNRKINRTFFKTHIPGSLDINVTLHIIQTRKRIAVIFFFLGGGETERNTQGQTKDSECEFFHFSSFPPL